MEFKASNYPISAEDDMMEGVHSDGGLSSNTSWLFSLHSFTPTDNSDAEEKVELFEVIFKTAVSLCVLTCTSNTERGAEAPEGAQVGGVDAVQLQRAAVHFRQGKRKRE